MLIIIENDFSEEVERIDKEFKIRAEFERNISIFESIILGFWLDKNIYIQTSCFVYAFEIIRLIREYYEDNSMWQELPDIKIYVSTSSNEEKIMFEFEERMGKNIEDCRKFFITIGRVGIEGYVENKNTQKKRYIYNIHDIYADSDRVSIF